MSNPKNPPSSEKTLRDEFAIAALRGRRKCMSESFANLYDIAITLCCDGYAIMDQKRIKPDKIVAGGKEVICTLTKKGIKKFGNIDDAFDFYLAKSHAKQSPL